jgi:hypothetical protein
VKVRYYATLGWMSLSELLDHVLTLDGSPVQIASPARMRKAPEVFPISIHRCVLGARAIRFGTLEMIYAEGSGASRATLSPDSHCGYSDFFSSGRFASFRSNNSRTAARPLYRFIKNSEKAISSLPHRVARIFRKTDYSPMTKRRF